MARGTMHAPKSDGQRRRRNAPTHSASTVERDGEIRGPALSGEYDPAVVEWYETWRRAPQAALFEATDWQRLRILAPIVQAYHRRPSAAALSEIRMNEERLGATVTDRMRARITITEPSAPDDGETEEGNVVSAADRFAARLGGGGA